MSRPSRYVDADTLDDIRSAHRSGVPLAELAARVGVDEIQLRRWLGLPQWQDEPRGSRLSWDLPLHSSSEGEL